MSFAQELNLHPFRAQSNPYSLHKQKKEGCAPFLIKSILFPSFLKPQLPVFLFQR